MVLTKRRKKQVMGLVGGSVVLGVGSSMVRSGYGGGINAFSSYLPMMGSALGAGILIDQLGGMTNMAKGRKKRRR